MSRVRGASGVVRAMERMAKEAGPTLGVQLRIAGEQIMTDVKSSRPGRGVPRDTGVLAATGRVDGPVPPRGVVTLTFGGAAAAYALVQHEELGFRHELGEPRYLVRGIERYVSRGGPHATLWSTAKRLIAAALRARAQARDERGRFQSGTRFQQRRRGTGG